MKIYQHEIFFPLRTTGTRKEQKTPVLSGAIKTNLQKINHEWKNIGMWFPEILVLLDCDIKEEALEILEFIKEHKLKCLVMHGEKGINFLFKSKLRMPQKELESNFNNYKITYKYNYTIIKLGDFEGERLDRSFDYDLTELDYLPIQLMPSDTDIIRAENKSIYGEEEKTNKLYIPNYQGRKIMEHYNVGHWIRRGSRWLTICPFHNDHSPSMVINRGGYSARCFVCAKSFYIEDFLALEKGGGN